MPTTSAEVVVVVVVAAVVVVDDVVAVVVDDVFVVVVVTFGVDDAVVDIAVVPGRLCIGSAVALLARRLIISCLECLTYN